MQTKLQEAPEPPTIDELFRAAMSRKWDSIVHAYSYHSQNIIESYNACSIKLDTALHIAVANSQSKYVRDIVEKTPKKDVLEILKMKNRQGNTPLHLAAAIGNLDMCSCITLKDQRLIAERNEEGETPLFLAAKRGQEKAFFYLEYCYKTIINQDIIDMLIKKKENRGIDTVLHSVIKGEHYGFARRIIESYRQLVDKVNNEGLTPLHVLALQPHSFKSRAHLGLFQRIFYKCIITGAHTWSAEQDREEFKAIDQPDRDVLKSLPDNYRMCGEIYKKMLKSSKFILTFGRWCNKSDGTKNKSEGTNNEANLEGGHQGPTTEPHKPSTTFCDVLLQILEFIAYVPLHFLGIWRWCNQSDGTNNKANFEEGHRGPTTEGNTTEHYKPSMAFCYVLFQRLKFMAYVPLHFLGIWILLFYYVELKKKHQLAKIVLKELLASGNRPKQASASANRLERAYASCIGPEKRPKYNQSSEPRYRGETPLLTAARLGIHEIVGAILKKFPETIEDKDYKKKNVVLLAAENRHKKVYRLLEKKRMLQESIFCQVDANGNSALHLASRYNKNQPWHLPGPALQLKWEITWHEYVEDSVPSNSFALRNNDRKTAKELFDESHEKLKEEGQKWLTDTCRAYSLISILIATVSFATSSTIPGDYDEGKPKLEPEFAFSVFTISSLIALCTSMTATVYFIAILTSQQELEDFALTLPSRLQTGWTFLFASITSMLISFGSGFYFNVRHKLENAAYPIFAVMCLPVTVFAISQLKLFIHLNAALILGQSKKPIRHCPIDDDY
ncbi:uncharacterized protein LOC116212874 isoform X2 [Punica granatum]|uniref:Uncharacterized protein LOC116212874 isoform X2 n=1 Tax=Punica granatum TaxID=22663 RepID=A0A218W5W6_PUNGR|nr:uncharacterized protein LOC116212874 isoform X2 [Punica granatum]OWM67621.1 hypothetical protein CDL15_Pgr024706 [Punica granatum]